MLFLYFYIILKKRTIIHIPSISRRIRKHFDIVKYMQTFQFGRYNIVNFIDLRKNFKY